MTRAPLLVLVGALALGAAACGTGSTAVSERAGAALTAPTVAPSSSTTTTTDPGQHCVTPESPPALSPVPSQAEASSDPFMKSVFDRKEKNLVVAVDENTPGLSARNPETSDLEGLEVTVAQRIAQRIYGGAPGEHVRFETVTTKEKIDLPKLGKVDLSISAISITCERWKDVAFSTEYLRARQAYLVRNESPIKTKEDLAGARVCVTTGSTSVGILDDWNTGYLEPQGKQPAKPVLVDTRNDCLLELQEGTVDAYLGHDTFINAMLLQDPGLRALPEGTVSHYGIAMNNDEDHNYFVRYVNGVLDELRADGTLPTLEPEPVR